MIDLSSLMGGESGGESSGPSQRQGESDVKESVSEACAGCKKSQSEFTVPLKRCAKCQTQRYCSRDCQKADWKVHKKICGPNQQNKPKATTVFGAMPKPAGNFFSGLVQDDYLHSLSEKDAFIRLIDCYRMRVEDDYKFAADPRGLYNDEDPLKDFQKFLNLAQKRKGVLPGWWNGDKRKACERLATDSKQWAFIGAPVEKSDIMEHYKDNMMPMKIRLLAEKIYGKRVQGGL